MAVPNGSITNVGETTNTYTMDWYGWEPGNYEIVEENLGTLTVEKLKLSVWTPGGTFEYDGDYHGTEVDLIYLNSSHALTPADCISYNTYTDGSVSATFRLFTGDTVTVTVPGCGPAVNEYTLTPSYSLTGNSSNYDIATSSCTVTISLDPYSTDMP